MKSYYRKLDWWLIICYLMLVITGWLNIYSSIYTEEHSSILDFSQRYGMQFIWILSALAIAGNPAGILVYFLIFNVPNYVCHYYGIHSGYKLGSGFIEKVLASGLLKKVTDVALTVGLTVLGALTASYVALTTNISITYDQASIDLQTILDGICPNLLPIALTLFCAWLMRKKNVKAPLLMIIVIIAGVILGTLGLI